ncbi:MAG: leucine-rich repeat protein [Clostridiales bacterium]|nr:leucine-rich repeat protein [Clostridiales bacterium]
MKKKLLISGGAVFSLAFLCVIIALLVWSTGNYIEIDAPEQINSNEEISFDILLTLKHNKSDRFNFDVMISDCEAEITQATFNNELPFFSQLDNEENEALGYKNIEKGENRITFSAKNIEESLKGKKIKLATVKLKNKSLKSKAIDISVDVLGKENYFKKAFLRRLIPLKIKTQSVKIQFKGINGAEIVDVSTTSLNAQTNQSVKLNAVTYPEKSEGKVIRWNSSNPKAVTVDANGIVKAVGLGNSVVTANIDGYIAKKDISTYIEGQCGENLVWHLENGVLSINGSGNMWNFTAASPAPWHTYCEYIGEVFLNGVESIGDMAFCDCLYVSWITLPKSIKAIGNNAFANCSNIKINCYDNSISQQYAVKNSIKYNIYVEKGDIENKGVLPSCADLLKVFKVFKIKKNTLDLTENTAADFNDNKEFNIADALMFLEYMKNGEVSSYNTEKYIYQEQSGYRYATDLSGKINTYTGVDVSEYQNKIDWATLKNADTDFAYIRLGYRGYLQGQLKPDSEFENNANQASTVGMPFGVYFFTQAVNKAEAIEEADYVVEKLSGYTLKLPVAIDMEDLEANNARAKNLTNSQRTEVLNAFCERIAQRGYYPVLYTNINYYYHKLDYEKLGDYDIWFAHYTKDFETREYNMWQYSSSGIISGITTAVDLNISQINYPAMLKNYGYW